MNLLVLLLSVVLLTVEMAAAADGPGLTQGSNLPGPFRPFNVANSTYEGKFFCLICEHGLNPGVLIFVQNVKSVAQEAPLAKLLRKLDTYALNNPKTRLRVFAVFLYADLPDMVPVNDARAADAANDARVAHADELRTLQKTTDLRQVVLALDGATNLQKAGYEIDPTAEVVVVLYDKLKVQKVFSYATGKLTAADVDAILAEEARQLLLLIGEEKLGKASVADRAAVQAMSDLNRLEKLTRRAPRAANWTDLLNPPQPR